MDYPLSNFEMYFTPPLQLGKFQRSPSLAAQVWGDTKYGLEPKFRIQCSVHLQLSELPEQNIWFDNWNIEIEAWFDWKMSNLMSYCTRMCRTALFSCNRDKRISGCMTNRVMYKFQLLREAWFKQLFLIFNLCLLYYFWLSFKLLSSHLAKKSS